MNMQKNDSDNSIKNADIQASDPSKAPGLFSFVHERTSEAYDSESLRHLLSKYSEDELKRQSDRLSSLYDEPEEPDYSEIDFGEKPAELPASEDQTEEPLPEQEVQAEEEPSVEEKPEEEKE